MKKIFLLIVFFPSALFGQANENLIQDYLNLEFAFSAGVGNVRVDNSILDANYERTYAAKIGYGFTLPSRLSVGALAMYDYYSESVLITCISMLFAIAIAYGLLPYFNQVVGKSLLFSFSITR